VTGVAGSSVQLAGQPSVGSELFTEQFTQHRRLAQAKWAHQRQKRLVERAACCHMKELPSPRDEAIPHVAQLELR